MKVLDKCCQKFNEHPNQVGETYWQHFKCALGLAKQSVTISGILVIHAICPMLYRDTASQKLECLYQQVKARKQCQMSNQ